MRTVSRTSALAKHANAIRSLGKKTVANIVEIGRRLVDCRDNHLEHGQWLPWLEHEFGWSRAHVVARARSDDKGRKQPVAKQATEVEAEAKALEQHEPGASGRMRELERKNLALESENDELRAANLALQSEIANQRRRDFSAYALPWVGIHPAKKTSHNQTLQHPEPGCWVCSTMCTEQQKCALLRFCLLDKCKVLHRSADGGV